MGYHYKADVQCPGCKKSFIFTTQKVSKKIVVKCTNCRQRLKVRPKFNNEGIFAGFRAEEKISLVKRIFTHTFLRLYFFLFGEKVEILITQSTQMSAYKNKRKLVPSVRDKGLPEITRGDVADILIGINSVGEEPGQFERMFGSKQAES